MAVQRAEEVLASDALLRDLEAGERFPDAEHLIKGVRREARRRRYGLARRLEGCCIGLPIALPVGFDRPLPNELTRVALPDYETLEWRCFLFQAIDGVTLPVGSVGQPIRFALAPQTRALLGATQTWLERNRNLVYREDGWRDHNEDLSTTHRGHGIRVRYAIAEMFQVPGPRLAAKLRGVCWNHSTEPFALRLGRGARR
jgi:hypothetical protein